MSSTLCSQRSVSIHTAHGSFEEEKRHSASQNWMELDEHFLLSREPSRPMDAMMEFSEDYEDFTAADSRASVVSSEWGNVSSSGSTSSADNQLSAKDVANWREFWEIWSNHHRLATASIGSLTGDHPLSRDIYSVFQLAYHIPRSWFYINPAEPSHFPDRLREYLAEIADADRGFFGENDNVASQKMTTRHALGLATTALDIHGAALRLVHDQFNAFSDEQWAAEIHDALIVRCARGHLLGASESWSLPTQDLSHADPSPTAASILSVRKIRPRGAIPILAPGEIFRFAQAPTNTPSFFAATFSTRAQIASPLRDTPEPHALQALNTMATGAALAQLSAFGIDLPVFGILFDRNIVRFHVDWSVPTPGYECKDHITLPLPHADHASSSDPPFGDFDLTRPADALRVAFLLDAIHAYGENRLGPAVGAQNRSKMPLAEDEISSEEKVHAWMQSGAVDAVGSEDS